MSPRSVAVDRRKSFDDTAGRYYVLLVTRLLVDSPSKRVRS
jgi:hypothetical protein